MRSFDSPSLVRFAAGRTLLDCVARLLVFVGLVTCVAGADWPRFRGPEGTGVSNDSKVALTWGESENIAWKTPLPGPGSSSPIVSGDRVFLVCYSGYGVDRSDIGNKEDLKRHLVCLDRTSGKILWDKSVRADMPEDDYRGFITEHGYASSTPVTDGETVFVFFGKTGVLAFDFEGNQLWKTSVGKESSSRRWGSASSPILYKDTVIVNASEESQSLRALDKKTGKEVWKAEAGGLELAYGTPLIVESPDGSKELVISVPNEVWALNPDTGKSRWYAETGLSGPISPSVVEKDGVVYVAGSRQGGSAAIRTGGKGDVTETHVVWKGRESTYVPSPLIHGKHLYWVSDRGYVVCIDAASGKTVFSERLSGELAGGASSRSYYASISLINGKLVAVSRVSGTFIVDAAPVFKQIRQNRIASDKTDFNASPAVSDGDMFLRSNQFLYCIREGGSASG